MPTQLFLLRPTTTASTATISHPSKPPRISLKTTLCCPYWFRSRRSNIVARSSGDEWKLDKDVVREKMSSWLVKARGMFKDVASPLVNSPQGRSLGIAAIDSDDGTEIENVIKLFLKTSEVTLNRKTPTGYLSPAAVLSIEQFGRMNGLTGRKIQQIYEDVAPEHIRYDARSLVEYACFRYLSKDRSIIRASLKDIAFQRLIFIAMLAWQQPYTKDGDLHTSLEKLSFQILVGEKAFIRIASAIPDVADRSISHHIFKALVGDEHGLSLSLWSTYISELLKVYQGRKSYENQVSLQLSSEEILCVKSSSKQPVMKLEKNIARPGKLILTSKALYFEPIGLKSSKHPMKFDLTQDDTRIEKNKIGPFGSRLFDSAITISSGAKSETWVLEFIDFGSEDRRDVWHAFISEIISLYKFIHEYGPLDDDPSIYDVYDAHKGTRRAIRSATKSIARLQSLHCIGKLFEDPSKLMLFSYLQSAPYGDVVLQTLAVNIWGGPLITQFKQENKSGKLRPLEHNSSDVPNVRDIDGSVYLRKWMRSKSWTSNSSTLFWKDTSAKKGIILGKNLVVGGFDTIEKASLTCREKTQTVEKTQETIDAAMIEGIPSNIDLLKELTLPFMILTTNFEKLRRWEEPRYTVFFLLFAYTVIFRNLLSYIFPMFLMILATAILLMKGLKEQGRLGRYFGKVTIRDQPASNTIQKIIAVKEALANLESTLQTVNVSLLKIRTIALSGQPEVETSKSSDETMDLESKKDITNHSNEENKQETVKEEKEEDDDEEEAECPFCLFMKGGGCKENFIAWENCVEEGEKNNEDIVEKCFEVTTLLKKCMEANPEYYEPILKAEKAMEEEVSQTLEQESQSETTTTATTSTKSEDNDDMVQKTFTQDKQV